MKYDFDEFVDRRGTAAVKWNELPDGGDEVIPMWVADMDFRIAPCITRALHRRVDCQVFGYVDVSDEYYQSIISWYERRHNFKIEREWINYTTSVIPAVSSALRAMTSPGNKVAVLTPVYNCFFTTIEHNRCQALEVPLLYDNDSGGFAIDYSSLESALEPDDVKVLLFCNPHNPAGRVWTVDELTQVARIALRHNVVVVSDEIHCELVMPGLRFTPMASLSEEILNNTITCSSPSKNFNTASLLIANIITSRDDWRAAIEAAIADMEVGHVTPFGMDALIAAYNEGEDWLDQLNVYLQGNYQLLVDYFRQHLPLLVVSPLEGTYLAWVNIRPTGMTSTQVTELLLDKAKVMVNDGSMYGAAGEGFIRLNLALPRPRLATALKRISEALG